MVQSIATQALTRQAITANGTTKTGRISIDFLVDGVALLKRLVEAHGGHSDFMGCFVHGYAQQNQESLAVLTGQAPPETKDGRSLLYVCPECGDVGCGSYAARVNVRTETVEWYDFAYENGYEPARSIPEVGPFVFDRREYENVLGQASAA